MKTLYQLFTFTFLIVVNPVVFGQEVSVSHYSDNQFVFWIAIRAQIKISNETKKEVYVIQTARNKAQSGKVLKYEKSLWRNLNSGYQLLIGPFTEYNDAMRAAEMYKLSKFDTQSMQAEINNYVDSTAASEYYWFFLKFKIMPRTKRISLERTAARVAFGTLKDFRQVLWEGLNFQQLAIGPFQTQVEAEEAKRLYRLEEY